MKAVAKFANQNHSGREFTSGKHKLPYVMTKEQLINTLVAINDVRMAMVMFVGCFQGLRIGEIVNLEWSEIDLLHGELRILDAKNTKRFKSGYGKDRIVPINNMFLEVYQRWREMNPKEKYFLPRDNRCGIEAKSESMIRNYQKYFNDALKKVKLLVVDFYMKNGVQCLTK